MRFAVTLKNGLTSHTWGVRTEKTGDTYIYCRETMKEIKVSLHRSGRQQIAFTKGSGHEMTPNSRFWKRWWQPSPDQRPPVPSVKLLFPSWATTLGNEQRKGSRKLWDTNQILIEGDDKFMTAILFFVMDEGCALRQDTLPSDTIAVMPLIKGKELHVIACKQHEGNYKETIEKLLPTLPLPLKADMTGDLLTALLAGDDPHGCPCLLPLLLDVKMRVPADYSGMMAYGYTMKLMVDNGYYTDPEPWESLDVSIQEAWKTIGTDWLQRMPKESKIPKLIAEGFIEVEDDNNPKEAKRSQKEADGE